MDFNHINKALSEEQASALKKLFGFYHKQYWCYKKMFKKFKKLDLALKLSSVVLTTSGVVVGTITLNPIILACLSGVGVFLQTCTNHITLTKKIEACRYAFQSYLKLINKIKLSLRSGEVDSFLERELAMIDDLVAESSPPLSDRIVKLYSKQFL